MGELNAASVRQPVAYLECEMRKEGVQGVWGTEDPQWGPGAKPRWEYAD